MFAQSINSFEQKLLGEGASHKTSAKATATGTKSAAAAEASRAAAERPRPAEPARSSSKSVIAEAAARRAETAARARATTAAAAWHPELVFVVLVGHQHIVVRVRKLRRGTAGTAKGRRLIPWEAREIHRRIRSAATSPRSAARVTAVISAAAAAGEDGIIWADQHTAAASGTDAARRALEDRPHVRPGRAALLPGPHPPFSPVRDKIGMSRAARPLGLLLVRTLVVVVVVAAVRRGWCPRI